MRKFALALVAAALGTAPQSLCAQSIRGTVSLPDSSRAAGAIVTATGANGGAPAQALTNANGEYTLRLPGAGSYTLTILRIGFRPMLVPPFDVAANETQTRSIVLRTDPVRLAQVNVTGSTECRVKPDSGLAVAQAWNEARHALLALQLVTNDAPLVVDKVEYSRRLDATGRFIRDQTVHMSQNPTNHAYISLPADVLAARGYAIDTADSTVYFAPDASVLLSESFAETHCLRLVAAPAGHEQLIGVGFEPVRTRAGVHDIIGTFWIDATTAELRSLAFHYTGVPDFSPPLDASGSVEFLRMPDGQWLVSRWRIHTPIFGVQRSASRLDANPVTGVRSVQEVGGQVDRVTRHGTLLYRAVGDTMSVQLLSDDVLAKTAGATLKLVGTEYSAKADDRGLVTLTPVIDGEYTARVSTALTDSLGLDPVEHTIYVLSSARPDTIILPKAREIIRTVCPLDSLRLGGGILRGTVRDEHGRPLKQAAVTVTWKESIVTNATGFGWRDRTRGILTNDSGGWQMCGVPTNWNLVVKVVGDAGTEGRSVAVDANRPYTPVDLIATRAAGADSLIVATRALVEFTVVDPAGAPLSGAAIELSGAGATHSTVTGAGGRALVVDVPPGQLRVRVKRIGFIAGDVAATVAAGRNTVPIVLSPTLKPTLDTLRIVGDRPTHCFARRFRHAPDARLRNIRDRRRSRQTSDAGARGHSRADQGCPRRKWSCDRAWTERRRGAVSARHIQYVLPAERLRRRDLVDVGQDRSDAHHACAATVRRREKRSGKSVCGSGARCSRGEPDRHRGVQQRRNNSAAVRSIVVERLRVDRDVDEIANVNAVRLGHTVTEKRMRKVHVVCMLIVGISAQRVGAQTPHWVPITYGSLTVALDTSSLAKSPDGFPRATLMLTLPQPRGGGIKLVAKVLDVVDFDCSGRKLRRKQSITFDSEGEVVDSLPRTANQPWVAVSSNSALGAVQPYGKTPAAGSNSDFDELTAFCRTEFAHR